MSEAEVFEAQGRAHAQAKRLRSEIAAATVTLRNSRTWLRDIDTRIDRALQSGGETMRIVDELRRDGATTVERIARILEELQVKGVELTELQSQIEKF